MRTGFIVVAVLMSVICISSMALSQQTGQGSSTSNQQSQSNRSTEPQHAAFDKATELIGSTVKNSQGQSIAKVQNLSIDMESGNVAYVILSSGGYLGIGSKELIAVPWSSFKTGSDQRTLVLDITKQKLEQAPRFSQDKWPNMGDTKWTQQVNNYFGTSEKQAGQAQSTSGQQPTPMKKQ